MTGREVLAAVFGVCVVSGLAWTMIPGGSRGCVAGAYVMLGDLVSRDCTRGTLVNTVALRHSAKK